ncbi:MAG: diguanylate cyclase [Acidobacteriota bacterium]|nr:diguanylate cyclase [Acidobacteriota bacterium]
MASPCVATVVFTPVPGRAADLVLGVACLVIASTLLTFLIGAGRRLPFRALFVLLTTVVSLCGFIHMAAVVLPAGPHIALASYLSLVAVLVVLVVAALLPILLPAVLRILRAMPTEADGLPVSPRPQPTSRIPSTTLSVVPAGHAQAAPPLPVAPEQTAAERSLPEAAPNMAVTTRAVDEPRAAEPEDAAGAPPAPVVQEHAAASAAPSEWAATDLAFRDLTLTDQAVTDLVATDEVPPAEAQALLVAATESSLDAFFAFKPYKDSTGKVTDFLFTWLNHNGERQLQRRRGEVLGSRLTTLLAIDAAPNALDAYRLVWLTGKPYIHEFPLREEEPYGTWMRHHCVKVNDGIAITVTDITERRHTEQYLLHLQQHDPVTGLPTRALLDDRVLQAMARANRYRNKVAVAFVSVSSLEELREVHGGAFANEATQRIAKRLRMTVRATDSIIRLTGDEFVLVMPEFTQESDIRRAGATLVAVVQGPLTIGDEVVELHCSVGISIYPDTALTVQDLLRGADVAMYRAKTQGRSRYVLFSPVPSDSTEEPLAV